MMSIDTAVSVRMDGVVCSVKPISMNVRPRRVAMAVPVSMVHLVRGRVNVAPGLPVCRVKRTSTNVHPHRARTVVPALTVTINLRAGVQTVILVCSANTSIPVSPIRVRMVVHAVHRLPDISVPAWLVLLVSTVKPTSMNVPAIHVPMADRVPICSMHSVAHVLAVGPVRDVLIHRRRWPFHPPRALRLNILVIIWWQFVCGSLWR